MLHSTDTQLTTLNVNYHDINCSHMFMLHNHAPDFAIQQTFTSINELHTTHKLPVNTAVSDIAIAPLELAVQV